MPPVATLALWVVALALLGVVALAWQTVVAIRHVSLELAHGRVIFAEIMEEQAGRLTRDLEHSARNIVGRVIFMRPPRDPQAPGDHVG